MSKISGLLGCAFLTVFGVCGAHAQSKTLKADSLVCENESPAAFVARHEELAVMPGHDVLQHAKSQFEKLNQPLKGVAPGSVTDLMVKAIAGLFGDVVENCTAAEAAKQIALLEVGPRTHVAKISMPYRGTRATMFVLEQALE
jgi:hypothetical protein